MQTGEGEDRSACAGWNVVQSRGIAMPRLWAAFEPGYSGPSNNSPFSSASGTAKRTRMGGLRGFGVA